MKTLSIYDVIRAPLVNEKATLLSEQNKVSFRVSSDATKTDVKKAVEEVFKVKVKAVNVLNTTGKIKRFKGMVGKRSGFKKAIVTLEAGQKIDVMAGV
jgi:large subunit ribosomal protein L23